MHVDGSKMIGGELEPGTNRCVMAGRVGLAHKGVER